MPTYEYICEKCSHEFEAFQPISAQPLTDCPRTKCKGQVRRKIGGGAGLIFKGSGFYITDYRSESYKAAAKKEKETAPSAASANPDKKSSTASDKKPAAAKSAKN